MKLDSIFIFLIQLVQHMDNYSRILAAACPDSDLVTFLEKLIRDNGLMDLGLETLKEAFLAYRLMIFRSFNECFSLFANFTNKFCHYSFLKSIYYRDFFYFNMNKLFIHINITNMNHSIITEYQDDLQFSPAVIISKNLQSKSPERQTEDIYSQKLQTKVKELKNNIRKNKPLIDQLKAQRKFLKKICEKQKQKIQGIKVQLVKEQYENEIQQLRQQRHKLQDVITVIHQQSSNKARDFVEAKEQINTNFIQYSRALQEIRNQNKIYQEMVINKTQLMDERKKRIETLTKEIGQKLSIQRKYKEVMSQIQNLQLKKCFNP